MLHTTSLNYNAMRSYRAALAASAVMQHCSHVLTKADTSFYKGRKDSLSDHLTATHQGVQMKQSFLRPLIVRVCVYVCVWTQIEPWHADK